MPFKILLFSMFVLVASPEAFTKVIIDYGTYAVVLCSVLHATLPPWEALEDFPKAQKYYKLMLYIIGYIALNWRSTLWKSISTENGSKVSKVVLNGNSKKEMLARLEESCPVLQDINQEVLSKETKKENVQNG